MEFIIDTGADISVIPAINKISLQKSKITLLAANGTEIATYGQRLLNLNFGLRRKIQWLFTIADVNKAIIGTDFLSAFNFLVDIKHRRLIDTSTQ